MNRSIYFLLLLSFLLTSSHILTSCKRYEDGPALSFSSRESRVINDWQAVVISRNDIDIDDEFEFMHVSFREGGGFEWTFQLAGSSETLQFEGANPSWELATLDEEIKITYTDEDLDATRLLYFSIQRLKEDEMTLTYIDDGDNMRLRLAPR